MPKTQYDTSANMGEAENEKKGSAGEIPTPRKHARGKMGVEDKYLTTWTCPGGQTRRQIGYIMTNVNYRNAERTAQINTHWRANMGQNRRVQTMQTYYDEAQKYKTPNPSETGGELKYDIRELRLHPENSPNGTKNKRKKQ